MFKVGQQFRQWKDRSRQSWTECAPRPLNTVIWYPTEDSGESQDLLIGEPVPVFVVQGIVRDRPLRESPSRFPVVVMSHGTGGSALHLGWLGRALASRGYIVLAVDHHGNTASEHYLPHGFLLWWERAKDLTAVLNCLIEDPIFGHRVDGSRVGAAGFSLGGYTAAEVAGARCSVDHLKAFSQAYDMAAVSGPREFPEIGGMWDELMAADEVFRQSVAEHTDSFKDPWVKAAFLMNPALGGAFSEQGFRELNVPVHILVAEEDKEVPPQTNGCRYADLIDGAELTCLEGPVGHYVFLPMPTAAGRQQLPHLCQDDPAVDRQAVHAKVSRMAGLFFDRHL